jgi:hypothetical protein
MFPKLVANDYKSHVVVNGVVTFWLIFTSEHCLPNNILIFIKIDKFEPNFILVNINKLKPYRYLGQAPKGL